MDAKCLQKLHRLKKRSFKTLNNLYVLLKKQEKWSAIKCSNWHKTNGDHAILEDSISYFCSEFWRCAKKLKFRSTALAKVDTFKDLHVWMRQTKIVTDFVLKRSTKLQKEIRHWS